MNIAENILREIVDITKRIIFGDYRYTDIKVLYINIRELSNFGSITREIGDFVAHNERNKGLVFDRIQKYYQALSPIIDGNSAILDVATPYSESEVIEDLVDTLLTILPNHGVYIERIKEHKQGVFMCVLCILQGALFIVDKNKITLSWNAGKNNNWVLMSDIAINHNGTATTVSVITFQSTLALTEVNKMQAPPFDCYERDGTVNVHMMW